MPANQARHETPRMTDTSRNTPRLIKKYPNRRLYDTHTSSHLTLADIRQLVVDKVPFQVVDAKSGEDLTRSILLQVIAEQENGEPMMSQDFLSQVIRSYGGAMQGFVGSYLENSLKLFATQQQQMRDRMNESGNAMPDPFTALASLTQKNMDFWRSMQDQFFDAMKGAQAPRKPTTENESEPTEDHKEP